MKNEIIALSYLSLCQKTDPKQFNFEVTDEIKNTTDFVGQDRALGALHFGTNIKQNGFNLYAMGPPGMGKREMIRTVLEVEAKKKPIPNDWCYIHNFQNAQKPTALSIPAGWGIKLQQDMLVLIEELNTSIPLVFESEDFRSRMQKINDELTTQQEKMLKDLSEEAKKADLVILPSKHGFAVAPLDNNGEVMSNDTFAKLSEEIRNQREEKISEYTQRLTDLLKKIPLLYKKRRKKEKELEKEFTLLAVGHLIKKLSKKYEAFSTIENYLQEIQDDIVANVKDFLKVEEGAKKYFMGVEKFVFSRYEINLIVDNSLLQAAPVIFEEHPTYSNLICRVEHVAQFGALLTDFTLIRAGAIHKAIGGYLILDAKKLLMQPFAWEGLKRALYTHKIKIEPPERMAGFLNTMSLDPEPIPLEVKIVLLGDRHTYYLLCELDCDFNELFKVAADFEETINYTPPNIQIYGNLLATIVTKENLLPFHNTAIASIIDYGLRLAEDREKISTHMRSIIDIMREASFYAEKKSKKIVDNQDVSEAIKNKIYRLSRLKELIYEEISRDIIMIETAGTSIGQINGLSLLQIAGTSFGHPSKITARVHFGKGEVIDIQREVKLSGPIHAKGVLILSAFLSGRYTKKASFSLSATLVFEQTYGMIEGDSASVAELCVLLSAISDIPIAQGLAVTGSINQHGEVQAIGGVNDKIEGFFDICKDKGFTGTQGVLIPTANLKNLMLREDIVEAAKLKKFHIYPIANIDEAIQRLTGVIAGVRNKDGKFSKGSINELVESSLQNLAKKRRIIRSTIIKNDTARENEEQKQIIEQTEPEPPTETK